MADRSHRGVAVAAAWLAVQLSATACHLHDRPPPTPAVVVHITPATPVVASGGQVQLHAAVDGTTDQAVDWSASGGGQVTATGLFLAPAGPLDALVTARAHADPTAVASVTVHVNAADGYITPDVLTGTDLTVEVDAHATRPISRFLYGLNNVEFGGKNAAAFGVWASTMPATTLSRVGGNRSTGLDWETGYSNCGSDCGASSQAGSFRNDANLLDNVFAAPGVGAAWRPRVDGQLGAGSSIVVTAPILGWVAGDASGQQPIPVYASHTAPGSPSTAHWHRLLARDPAGATATPDTADGAVYTDDLVKWLDTTWPGRWTSTANIQVSLDNEPDLWKETHAEIVGTATGAFDPSMATTDLLALPYPWYPDRSLEHAAAVKDVAPEATLWAGGFAGYDGLFLFNYGAHPEGPPCADGSSPAGSPPTCPPGATPQYTWFVDYLLDRWHAAAVARGRPLVDVLDVHWYVQALAGGAVSVTNDDAPQTSAVVDLRVQSPRSLWDPDYIEGSWINAAIPTAFQQGCDANHACPIMLLPRLQASIDAHAPGLGLAIGEYWYGRGGDVSSTIANADVLGILARAGAHASAMWWNASNIWAYNQPNGCADQQGCTTDHAYRCALMAIDVYRNFDGAGATFGDTFVATAADDPGRPPDPIRAAGSTQTLERVTAYAGGQAGDPNRLVVVVINKTTGQSLQAGLRVTATVRFGSASVYRVTGVNGGAGGCTLARAGADLPITKVNAWTATLPPQSVTIFQLRP